MSLKYIKFNGSGQFTPESGGHFNRIFQLTIASITCVILLSSMSDEPKLMHWDRHVLTTGNVIEEHVNDSTSDLFVLRKGNISIEIQANNGFLNEKYLVYQDNEWVEIAIAKGESSGAVSITDSSNQILQGNFINMWKDDDSSITEEMAIGNYRITRKLALVGDGLLHVTTCLNGENPKSLHSFFDRFSFSQDPDWSYAPSIGGFVPDAYYKAPVVMCQSNNLAFAIIPDLNQLSKENLERCNHFLSLNLPAGRLLSTGYAPATLVAHSVYAENQEIYWQPNKNMENSYFLLIIPFAEKKQAYRQAVRFLWDQLLAVNLA